MKNYYGIEGVIFHWHGEWADPEVEYNGKIINEVDLLEYFAEVYEHQTNREWDFSDECAKFMLDNTNEVRYYIAENGRDFQ